MSERAARWNVVVGALVIMLALAVVFVQTRPEDHAGAERIDPGSAASATPPAASPHPPENAQQCDVAAGAGLVEYPITGYFVFTDHDSCRTRAKVAGAHRIGADTLITFGAEVERVSLAELRSSSEDNAFAAFRIDERDGYEHALGATDGGRIRSIYTYANRSVFGNAALPCGEKNGQASTESGIFTWWLFPVEGGYSDCDSASRTYDLYVSYSASSIDADGTLILAARALGMQVYLGLPKPQQDPKTPYVADTSYTQTLGAFTSRVLADRNAQFGADGTFAGVYQTVETAAFTDLATWRPNLELYELQNRIVTFQLPKSRQRVIVSPYADLREGVTPVSAIASSFQHIARTAAGVTLILAPQDGAGTGRVGLYGPDEASERVRADLHDVVGDRTYDDAYAGSVETLYAEAAKVRGVELWANVEAFRPQGTVGDRAPTTLDTLDMQIELADPYVRKVISYRWDGYLDHSGLAKEIVAQGG